MVLAGGVSVARRGLHVLIIGRRLPVVVNDELLEELYERVRGSTAVAVARCDGPESLVDVVGGVARQSGVPGRSSIATLDLYDHGAGGRMVVGDGPVDPGHLGRDPMAGATGGHEPDREGHGAEGERATARAPVDVATFASKGKFELGAAMLWQFDLGDRNRKVAEDLRDYLAPDARVRLLGCQTACGPEGRRLLLSLHDWLNGGGETGRVVYGTIHNIRPDDFDVKGRLDIDEAIYLFSSIEAREGVAPSLEIRIDRALRGVGGSMSLLPPRDEPPPLPR